VHLSDLIQLEQAFREIRFVEKDHSYKINGQLAEYSVTRLLKKYQKPFDSKYFAAKVARRDGMTVEEVLELWDFKKEYSCHKGTSFHSYAENFFHRKQLGLNKDSISLFCRKYNWSVDSYYEDVARYIENFLNFYEWWKQDHILVKTELVVGDADLSLGGTIDNLSFNTKTNKMVLFDYKTNKAVEANNKYGSKMLLDLKHLEDCELVKYSLQLWIYNLLIHKHTNIDIEENYIVWVGGDSYELIPSLNLKREAQLILDKTKLA
jgi:ATP-dependent exoDNAse (exonuclease V) beta subunit